MKDLWTFRYNSPNVQSKVMLNLTMLDIWVFELPIHDNGCISRGPMGWYEPDCGRYVHHKQLLFLLLVTVLDQW